MPGTLTTQDITYANGGKRHKVALAAGETSDPIPCSAETVIVARPAGGGTINVEATWSQPKEVTAGTAAWMAWDQGAVSENTMGTLFKATAVRFVCATAAGAGEVAT